MQYSANEYPVRTANYKYTKNKCLKIKNILFQFGEVGRYVVLGVSGKPEIYFITIFSELSYFNIFINAYKPYDCLTDDRDYIIPWNTTSIITNSYFIINNDQSFRVNSHAYYEDNGQFYYLAIGK